MIRRPTTTTRMTHSFPTRRASNLSTVANTVATLEQYGALEYTVVVVAGASDPAPFKYLAPYAGCAMGQHWMESGEHGLIVYDDLSKQDEAYRQVSLQIGRAHVCTPVTNSYLVCRRMLEKKK